MRRDLVLGLSTLALSLGYLAYRAVVPRRSEVLAEQFTATPIPT